MINHIEKYSYKQRDITVHNFLPYVFTFITLDKCNLITTKTADSLLDVTSARLVPFGILKHLHVCLL